MLKKKILALLAAVSLACSLVGCQADTDTGQVGTEQNNQQTNIVQSLSTKAKSDKDNDKKEETAEIETKSNIIKKEPYYITDWLIDDLITNIEMNGVTYSMPFTFNDLGEDYTIEKINDELIVYYRGENYALIKVKDKSDDRFTI